MLNGEGFLAHIPGNFEPSLDFMRHSIAILEALADAFPLSSTLTASIRGGTFTPSVHRGFLLILGHIICYVAPSDFASDFWTNFRAGMHCRINAQHSQGMKLNRLLLKY
jgi:hypothetical protein